MDDESTINLKRGSDQLANKDAPPSKRRNTGNIVDLRRSRRGGNVYMNSTGGTLNDPLNLNNVAPDNPIINNDRKRRFDEIAPGAIYQRRMSFRQPKKRAENPPPTISEEQNSTVEARKVKHAMLNKRYRYGNFNYIHRTNAPFNNDPRLDLLVEDWFKGKNVLDLGCNSGLLTLSIARTFSPRRILGVDIDSHLIGAARKNIRHFQDKDSKIVGKFPASFPLNFGPITTPSSSTGPNFPDNVWFRQENYVLDNDELLEGVHEEFDIILAFKFTKWIHLNFGDSGLKRFFKRVFKQLKPGGRFVFEPQSSRGYRTRSKMVPEMEQNYKSIKFWPDQFVNFLMSNEVGFCRFEALDTPLVQALDCDAPILMFYKGPLMDWGNTPATMPETQDQTPEYNYNQMQYTRTPRGDDSQCASTPRDDSSPVTPENS